MRAQKPDWWSMQWWAGPFNKKTSPRDAGEAADVAATATEGFQVALRQLTQRERRLWVSLAVVTSLCAIAYLLSGWPAARDVRYEWMRVTQESAAPALLSLLLLLNFWVLRQRAQLHSERQQLLEPAGEMTAAAHDSDAELPEEDPLTGLPHRGAAAPRLEKELVRARRHAKPVSVLLADIDDFRELNARHGAGAGDQVLQEFATRLRRATRGIDSVIRMGGDEFLAVLPECSVGSVQRVCDRLSPMTVSLDGEEIEVTCSVSSFDHHPDESVEELLRRAEQMLKLQSESGSVLRR